MDAKIDFTLCNQIKEKFSIEKGTFGLVSLTSDKIEDLVMRVFTNSDEDLSALHEVMRDYGLNYKPYAAFDRLYDEHIFVYRSKEFLNEIDLVTGKVLRFRLDPLRKIDFNKVRKELAELGRLLSGNSKAS